MSTTTSITEDSLENVSELLQAWRSYPDYVTVEADNYLSCMDEASDIESIFFDDDDSYFCPLPHASTARDHWELLSSVEKRDSSLKQTFLRPPPSLEIPPRPTHVPNPPIRRKRPNCLFINYLGTRLPSPSVAASSKLAYSKPTSAPAAGPSAMPTINPNLSKSFKTPAYLVPAYHTYRCEKMKPLPPSSFILKVPIHLKNLKLPAVVPKVKRSASSKRHAPLKKPVESIASDVKLPAVVEKVKRSTSTKGHAPLKKPADESIPSDDAPERPRNKKQKVEKKLKKIRKSQ